MPCRQRPLHAAALRLGFSYEGIQERHMIAKDRFRDTAWFRLLRDERPAPLRAAQPAASGSRPREVAKLHNDFTARGH